MAAARKRHHALARTRKVVGLLQSAPPLWEVDRYAIAQALAETTSVDKGTAPRTVSTEGGARPLAGGAPSVQEAWEAYQEALEADRAARGQR